MDDDHRREKYAFIVLACVCAASISAWFWGPERRTLPKRNETSAVKTEMATAEALPTLNDFLKPPAGKESKHTAKVQPLVAMKRKTVRENKFHPIIEEAANQYAVDPALIKAIIRVESNFDPNAVSEKGALGLMQLMPSTARSLGINDCFDPVANIKAGVRYFKQLMIQFDDDPGLALAAYNAGIENVMEHQGIPPFKSTRRFINKVLRYYREI